MKDTAPFLESTGYKTDNWRLSHAFNEENTGRPLTAGYLIEDAEGRVHAVRVAVPLAMREESNRVIVRLSPWSSGVNDSNDIAEAAAVVEATGARVISFSVPGLDKGSSGFTKRQRNAVRNGDFSAITAGQPEVLKRLYQEVFGEELPPEVIVWGSSQGATHGIAMIRGLQEAGINVLQFIAGADTALVQRNIAKLAFAYLVDGIKNMPLLEKLRITWRDRADKTVFDKTMPSFLLRALLRPSAHLFPAWAIARGQDATLLTALAASYPHIQIDQWGGGNDPISKPEHRDVLAIRIGSIQHRQGALATSMSLTGAPHGVAADITAIYKVARELSG